MHTDLFTYLFLGAVSIFYVLVLMSGRAGSGHDFYTLHAGVTPVARGMGLAADWLCAATFLSFFGVVSQHPEYAHWLLVGWLSGLILLGAWIAPGVYRSGQSCLTGLVAHYYQSNTVRYLFLATLTAMSVILLALQLKGLGLIFSRHLQMSKQAGILIALLLLLFYVVISGMRALTRVQMLKFCLILCAIMMPAMFLASEMELSGHWFFLQSQTHFASQSFEYEFVYGESLSHQITPIEWMLIVLSLLAGTSILPYMLKRFQGAKTTQEIRHSAIWMLVFTGLIYASMPWIGTVSQSRFVEIVEGPIQEGVPYSRMPSWFFAWEQTGELVWQDINQDGRVQSSKITEVLHPEDYNSIDDVVPDNFFNVSQVDPLSGFLVPQPAFELTVANEIKLLLLPEMFEMDPWIIALLTVGISAALLSTSSIVLISMVHSLVLQSNLMSLSGRLERHLIRGLALLLLSIAAVVAMTLSGSLVEWINRVIALAAAALFPAVVFALFSQKVLPAAVATGMLVGLVSSVGYTLMYDLQMLAHILPGAWSFYPPVAVAALAMCLNFITVLSLTWMLQALSKRQKQKQIAIPAE